MSDVRPQQHPEKPQQELRFTAREPTLDEALAMLETEGERQVEHLARNETPHSYLPKDLFLFAMKRMSIDYSDLFDGYSKNESRFLQYRQKALNLSNNGHKRFSLDPWLKELRFSGPESKLVGVAMRLRVEPLDVKTLLADPFLDEERYREIVAKIAEDEISKPDNMVLRDDAKAAFIPIRYEIGKAVENPADALERLRGILELGTWVSQLTVVPSYPRSARTADIYREPRIDRTFDQVDARFASELVPATTPIQLSPTDDRPDKNEDLRDVS